MATSGTYNFQTIEVELIIREAYERIGIGGEFIEPIKLDSARRIINILLLEWMNKKVNLWTIQTAYLPLNTNQGQYTLVQTVSNIIQANIRTFIRQLKGFPRSNTGNTYDGAGGGNAANAFDSNPATACTQNVQSGNISYNYGADITQNINFVGIQSNANTLYSLVVEASQDAAIWVNILTIPPQTFTTGIATWFDIPAPINARYYRVRETGNQTLNIQEIYFTNNIFDLPISQVSRYIYYTYPTKQLVGRPSVYYLDRQIIPVLNIWPTPSNQYSCLQYTYEQIMQDAGNYTNFLQIPSRFYPALIWGLSYNLAIKYSPDKVSIFKTEYDQAFANAAVEDTEGVEITITADYNSGGCL